MSSGSQGIYKSIVSHQWSCDYLIPLYNIRLGLALLSKDQGYGAQDHLEKELIHDSHMFCKLEHNLWLFCNKSSRLSWAVLPSL